MYVGKVYSDRIRMKINTTFQGNGEIFGGLSTTVLQHLRHRWVQWCGDWMRWRWEGRDLPSLDERSPLLPRFSPHVVSGDAPQWGGTEAEWMVVYNGVTMFRGRRFLRRSGKEKKTKQKRWVCFNIPCTKSLSFLGWSLKQRRCPEHCSAVCRRATVSSALLLPASYTDMMCLTKAVEKKNFT